MLLIRLASSCVIHHGFGRYLEVLFSNGSRLRTCRRTLILYRTINFHQIVSEVLEERLGSVWGDCSRVVLDFEPVPSKLQLNRNSPNRFGGNLMIGFDEMPATFIAKNAGRENSLLPH
jgi:hypothetical protein